MIHLLLSIIYISFISLGLPDGLLGAAWPTIYPEFGVPVSYAGILFAIISVGTVVSSLMSDHLTYKLGTGKVTAISVCMTAVALFGFSVSSSYGMLCLWAIPYGLGAGSVDASLNNYVAVHYASRHMSWLHCMWGIGATVGPYIMGLILSHGGGWTDGYHSIGLIQLVLTALLFLSLPLWKNRHETASSGERKENKPLPLRKVISIPGAKQIMVTFFCYCALEQTTALWASSYLALYKGVPTDTAAFFASMFFIGITVGRGLNGFLTIKYSDTQLIRMGQCLILLGIGATLLPMGQAVSIAGLIFIGLGCAPIYPCIIHATPEHFGAENSQALIGVQMACAYVGNCLMPPLFGLIANHIHIALLPAYLFIILILMVVMHEMMLKKVEHRVGSPEIVS